MNIMLSCSVISFYIVFQEQMEDLRKISFRTSCMNWNGLDPPSSEKTVQTEHAVYYGNAENYIPLKEICMNLLSRAETDRMDKFVFEGDRLTYCISHGLLRMSLAENFMLSNKELELEFFGNGKPHLANVEADFNLAHSKNYFAYAFTDKDDGFVGVDIEKTDNLKDINPVVKDYMHPDEQSYILDRSLSIEEQFTRFYEIWTRKEAFLKMLGVGINTNLSEVNVLAGDNTISVDLPRHLHVNCDTAYLYTMITNHFVLSISSSFPGVPGFIEIKRSGLID